MGAEYGYFGLVDDQGTLDFRAGRDNDGNTLDQPGEYISYTIFEDVLTSGEVIITDDTVSSVQSERAWKLQLCFVMCVPLISRRKIPGAIYVENREEKGKFKEDDL